MKVFYYRFERETNSKYATRLIETLSTKDYGLFESARAKNERCERIKGALYVRYQHRPQTYGKSDIKPDFSVSIETYNLSSVKSLGLNTGIAFGDVNRANDAILFLLHDVEFVNGRLKENAILEIVVFEGQKNNQQQIAQRYASNEFAIVGLVTDAIERARTHHHLGTLQCEQNQ